MTISHFAEKAEGWYARKAVRLFFRRPAVIDSSVPLISFTFDDFPRSALLTGGAILKKYGLAGTYYASFGMMGKHAPPGHIFLREDLKDLQEQGHELGCHTFAHCDAWKTDPKVFEDSILENRRALNEIIPGAAFKTFSYPINVPSARAKQRASHHFMCCRGGGQSFNGAGTDLNYLSAYFLEKSNNNIVPVKDLIDRNREAHGWLILATHDVCEAPSPFGCTPVFFEDVVSYSVNSGARILPVAQVCELLNRRANGPLIVG